MNRVLAAIALAGAGYVVGALLPTCNVRKNAVVRFEAIGENLYIASPRYPGYKIQTGITSSSWITAICVGNATWTIMASTNAKCSVIYENTSEDSVAVKSDRDGDGAWDHEASHPRVATQEGAGGE